ncbi:MAG TPA: hypothetical protein DCF63_15985 [Planctomycetaceae bacterium]|nr:hypothetical protein [Planctomycetaceae bacterium]
MIEFTECPNCGKRVRATAAKCHHCGWTIHQHPDDVIGSPEHAQGGYGDQEDFDYDEFMEQEFGEKRSGLRSVWRAAAIVLIVVMLLPWLLQLFGIFPEVKMIPVE